MNCCHVAFFTALFFGTAVIIVVGLFLGYTVKISRQQIELEKKNGKEQKEIDELKKEIQELKRSRN